MNHLANMKPKLNILTILGAATATVIILTVIFNQIQLKSSQETKISDNFKFENVTENDVNKIEIMKKDETITLTKNNGIWMNGDQNADSTKISSFIQTVNNATLEKTVSQNSANHTKFEVDTENGVTVKFYKGSDKLVTEFIVGQYATGGGCYIRKVDGNNVYVMSNDITSYTGYTQADWQPSEEATTEDVVTE